MSVIGRTCDCGHFHSDGIVVCDGCGAQAKAMPWRIGETVEDDFERKHACSVRCLRSVLGDVDPRDDNWHRWSVETQSTAAISELLTALD